MTLLAGGVGALLAVALAAGVAGVSGAASRAAHAQVAADAAALAAAAESAPSGSGLPREAAADYAEANGARLLECLCNEGATAMQVRVSVDGAIGEARAVLDPALLAPATLGRWDDLHPVLAHAVDRLVGASFGKVWVVSGFRTRSEQEGLWAGAMKRHGSAEEADDWVARPGTSMHEQGRAVDLGGDLGTALRLIADLRLPLYRPLANEPWHFELADVHDGPA